MSVSSRQFKPNVPLPWVCILLGILGTVMCYAIFQATWAPRVGDTFLEVARMFGGTLAMVLTMDEILTKCVLFGLFLSMMVYSGVKAYHLETTTFAVSLFGGFIIMMVGISMFSEPENPSRLMVHKVDAEQALFHQGVASDSGKIFPTVDEKWISYYRCERVRKAYINAGEPYHARFSLQINGKWVGNGANGPQCKPWDMSRVTLSSLEAGPGKP